MMTNAAAPVDYPVPWWMWVGLGVIVLGLIVVIAVAIYALDHS